MLLFRMTVEEVTTPTPHGLPAFGDEPPEHEPTIQRHLPYGELNFRLELLLFELSRYV